MISIIIQLYIPLHVRLECIDASFLVIYLLNHYNVQLRPFKMYTSRKKIHKDKDVEPTEFEETVAQVLFDTI